MELGKEEELKPRDSVRRLLVAAGVTVPDGEAYWLGFHMERFVNHARKHGVFLDLPTAAEAYLAFFQQNSPPPPDWQLNQVKQALLLFARGIEAWRWVRISEPTPLRSHSTGAGGWALRYRVKTGGENAILAPAASAVSPKGPPGDLEACLV